MLVAENSHAQGSFTTAKNTNSFIGGKLGVLANPTTIAGYAWGDALPSAEQQLAGSEDVGLVWKLDQAGNSTQKR